MLISWCWRWLLFSFDLLIILILSFCDKVGLSEDDLLWKWNLLKFCFRFVLLIIWRILAYVSFCSRVFFFSQKTCPVSGFALFYIWHIYIFCFSFAEGDNGYFRHYFLKFHELHVVFRVKDFCLIRVLLLIFQTRLFLLSYCKRRKHLHIITFPCSGMYI